MHISEIGLCGGHSASGVWVDEHGATTVPGLYAAGDLACVPHNYMIGAFVFGDLAAALGDAHGTVRQAAATALRELVEVVPATPGLGAALIERLAGGDAVVRASALDVLRALRLGDRQTFAEGLRDADRRVRIEAIRGLVSLDEADLVATAAADPSREVRVWASGAAYARHALGGAERAAPGPTA
jgi:hypothetical protein